MKRSSILVMFLLSGFFLPAQFKVRFILQEKNPPKHDSIYIAGAFNNWSTNDIKYMLQPMDAAHKSIVITLPAGLCEYKFTRGSWLQVEKDYFCSEMENRRTEIHRDTTINIAIDFWMDDCNIENLDRVLQTQQEDTNKVNTLLAASPLSNDLSTSLGYANRAIALSDKIKFIKGKGTAYRVIGYAYYIAGKYPESRKFYLLSIETEKGLEDKSEIAGSYLNLALTYLAEENYPEWLQNNYYAIKFFEQSSDKMGMANAYASIGDHESSDGNDSEALKNYQISLKLYEAVGAGNGTWGVARASGSIARVYLSQGKYTEALVKDSVALKIFKELGRKVEMANVLLNMGNVYHKQGDLALAAGDAITGRQKLADAQKNSLEALKIHEELNYSYGIADAFLHLGMINMKLKNLNAARTYLGKSLNIFKSDNNKSGLEISYFLLSRLDSMDSRYKQAYDRYKLYTLYRDSLYNEGDVKKNVQIKMQYEFDKKEDIAKAEQGKRDAETRRIKNQQYSAIAGLAIVALAVVIIAFIQYKNNRHKQKANILLTRQKEKVESTLSELKSTQAQLIQQEKMASLGELTAGIAHEIQNPLNFVNNFSEVSNELIDEMNAELNKGDIEEAKAISSDIKQNLEKINHHGKRADAIVKGMLQHSQSSSGVKEPTEINALADEYLRLAYHGLKAKDKSFNVALKTEFDENIGRINIIPQDIGRVLLNLYNNAFYAVAEKNKITSEVYEPTVSVFTKKTSNTVFISVKDNGNGIPEKIKEKIFQPFFTTKPTGQGTGLGLSLSYDIVKAHGGELKVETKEGEGSEFIIQLTVA